MIDEKELRIPLEHSWQRQTKIRGIGKRGIVGEVLYHAPCGKKLRTYPDVMKVTFFFFFLLKSLIIGIYYLV